MGLQKHMTLKRTELLKQPNTILCIIRANQSNYPLLSRHQLGDILRETKKLVTSIC